MRHKRDHCRVDLRDKVWSPSPTNRWPSSQYTMIAPPQLVINNKIHFRCLSYLSTNSRLVRHKRDHCKVDLRDKVIVELSEAECTQFRKQGADTQTDLREKSEEFQKLVSQSAIQGQKILLPVGGIVQVRVLVFICTVLFGLIKYTLKIMN